MLLGMYNFFCGEWDWFQQPKDNGLGSRGHPGIWRVAEGDDALVAGRALVSALVLLLLKHKLVLVLIKGDR